MYKKCGEISLLCENFVVKFDILKKVSKIWRNMMSLLRPHFGSLQAVRFYEFFQYRNFVKKGGWAFEVFWTTEDITQEPDVQ